MFTINVISENNPAIMSAVVTVGATVYNTLIPAILAIIVCTIINHGVYCIIYTTKYTSILQYNMLIGFRKKKSMYYRDEY
jgi:hypothetical protein